MSLVDRRRNLIENSIPSMFRNHPYNFMESANQSLGTYLILEEYLVHITSIYSNGTTGFLIYVIDVYKHVGNNLIFLKTTEYTTTHTFDGEA